MSELSSRPLIIYLTDNLIAMGDRATDTAVTIWDGMRHAAEEADVDLMAVVGGGMRESFGSIIYDLITPESADGFISWISKGEGRTDAFFQRFDQSLLVALSTPYGGHPLVRIRGEDGMRELMHHLLQHHGYRRLAFIGGQKNHPYALERRQIFESSLLEAGITPNAEWMTDDGPSWSWQNGEAAIRCLLDERGLQPGRDLDVIVCASDRLAMGVLAELARRGIRVPQDLAVTGFNNLLEAQSHQPSLTSVGSPFAQQGRVAMAYLQACLRGERPPPIAPLPTVMVQGETCGCLRQYTPQPLIPGQSRVGGETDLLRRMGIVLQAMRAPPVSIEQACRALLQALRAAIARSEAACFLHELTRLIDTRHCAFIDQTHWQDVISLLRREWLIGLDGASQCLAEAILDLARSLIAEQYTREQTRLRQNEVRLSGVLRHISTRLGAAASVDECMTILAESMPSLGVPACWLSVFEPPVGQSRLARLLLAYECGHRLALPDDRLSFPARELIPGGLRRGDARRSLVMHPLAQGSDEFGFVIFEQGPSDGGIYDALADQISNALKSVWLRQMLANRSQALERSLAELRDTQEQLVEREKMAALGELVAGIAHEINTPIGIGVTSISTVSEAGQSLLRALEQRSARDVRSAALDMIDGAEIVQRNLERAGALIESFKLIAVDQASEAPRAFEMGAYLADIVRSLEPRLRPGQHVVKLTCPDTLIFSGDPGVMARIVSNLILNSVIHGFEGRQGGVIHIDCRAENERVVIEYRDNGRGMTPEVRERMFHPFFTTKRGRGGTGLGMHIVYNSVTQGLGGSIQCESAPDAGTRFVLDFPQSGV